ncbi:hypothetical protein AB0I69_42750 [Streptomyces sp. NPDC050508]
MSKEATEYGIPTPKQKDLTRAAGAIALGLVAIALAILAHGLLVVIAAS